MQRKFWMLLLIITIITLTACSENEENTEEVSEELPTLDVKFVVPETAEPNEKIELKAIVTYGEEPVEDADEVIFEVWEKGLQDDSSMLESENNEDGTYTAGTSFEKDGIYEIYAHTTARDLHTMPMKSITVGDASPDDYEDMEEQDTESEHNDH